MGTVKYTGSVASFHCPTEATIRSLKVHFSPKQEGSGDPSPENVRPIEGWDGVEVYNYTKTDVNTAIIPSEYKKVECLESTGTQYIETTTVLGSNNFTIEFEFAQTLETSAEQPIVSIWKQTYNYWNIFIHGSWRTLDVYTSAHHRAKANAITNDAKHTASLTRSGENWTLTLDGEQTTWVYTPSMVNDTTVKVLARGDLNAANTPYIKLYSMKLNISGSNAFELIPCVRKSDSKPGMYDIVSQTFYTNAGTDEFLYGPEVNGSTTNYEFGVLGKNKFDINLLTAEGIEVVDGVATGTGTAFNKAWRANDTKWIPFEAAPNQIITLSFKAYTDSNVGEAEDSTGLVVYMHYTDGSKNVLYLKNDELTPTYHTITSNNGKSVSHIGIGYGSRGSNIWHLSEFQIEYNDEATTYEPYNPNKTVYGGWVDLISGEVCEEYSKVILNGDNAFGAPNDYDTYYRFVKNYSTLGLLEPKETQYPISNWLEGRASPNGIYIGSTKNVLLYLNKDLNINTSEILSAYLAENPLEIVYELATPNTYSLAPLEMQTFLAQNNVWSNADYVEVEYDLHETQNILARKQFIMANQPHIVKPAVAPLQNFTTDVPAPLKECKVHFKPIQDLHGYDRPWVGGSGKNLFDVTKLAAETNSWTINILDLPIGTYTMSSNKGIAADTNIYMYFRITGSNTLSDSNVVYSAHSTTLTIEEGQTAEIVYRRASGTNLYSDYTWQIEKGSTATSYEPYENICPISGWTGVRVFQAGKNLMSDNHVLVGAQFKNVDGNYEIGTANIYEILSIDVPKNTSLHIHKEIAAGSELGLGNEIAYYGAPAVRIGSMTNYYNRDFNTGNYPYAYLMIGKDSTINDSDKQWQIEVGNVATAYEASKGTTDTTFDWSSAGTIYGGYVDLVTGEVWKEWENIELNSPSQFNKWNRDYAELTYLDFYTYLPNVTECISNITLSCANRSDAVASGVPSHWVQTGANAYVGFMFPASFFSTHPTTENRNDLIQEILNISTFKLAYKTNKSLVGTLAPTVLKTLRGTNNVWSSANDNIELSYWKH